MLDLSHTGANLPVLPLLLFHTPPGLELMLAQEGIAHQHVRDPSRHAFSHGRFVLYDSRLTRSRRVRSLLSHSHLAIDVETLRRPHAPDPFEAVVDNRSAPASWVVSDAQLTEGVAACDRAAVRRQVLDRLRGLILSQGGVWARLAPFPHPYRSAFNLRIDLDEPSPDDYFRFAQARRPLDDCTTHFISTHAYSRFGPIMADLRGRDSQSHAHFHFIYRDEATNRRNLTRAHQELAARGIEATGFAAPGGRWNSGLNRVVEELGYHYASDFHLGYDDVPFFPHVEGRFSPVLQVPIHPVCEGLFLEAGLGDPTLIASYLQAVVRARIEAGEPAFVYGHPEGRLGRFPQVITSLAREVSGEPYLWRVTLTDFARWWRWRGQRRWALLRRSAGRYELQFEEWDPSYQLALEIHRGDHVASLRIDGPRVPLDLGDLAYVRRRHRFDRPSPLPARAHWGLRHALRRSLDWETVTPLDELPDHSVRTRLKKRLRKLRSWRTHP